MAIDELYLENLDEFINDENKVVTYKWLSRSLGVHVNQAKQMLHAFVQQQRNQKDNDSLSVLYLLAGTVSPAASDAMPVHQVSLVPEEQLEAAKAGLEAVTSCHMYSVQRSQLKDTNSLYTADYDLLRDHLTHPAQHSAIRCASARRRTDQELQGLRQRGAEAYAPSYNAKSSSTNGQSKKSQQNAIGAMFGKASKKEPAAPAVQKPKDEAAPKPQDKTHEAPLKESKTASKDTKKGGALASMFAKQAAKPKPEPKPEPKKAEEPMEVVEVEKPKKPAQASRTSKTAKSKKDADRHPEENGKRNKRRRIREAVSSSSEDEVDIEEVPPTPPREPSPEPEPVPVESEEEAPTPVENQPPATTTTTTTTRRRKRRRKHVDKTYLDDDGFMVTEKVWESESTDASDIEEPKAKVAPKPRESTKAPAEKPTKKKASPNKATGKQTSLMNFFKKK